LAKKVNTFWSEFKAFITRGNVFDLAVGLMIGAAFQGIVSALVDNIIMPLVTVFTCGLDFTEWFIPLDGNSYPNLAAAEEAGAATIQYGMFIAAIINFLIMAVVIFMIIKIVGKLTKQKDEPAEAPSRQCPYCKSDIDDEAVRCPHCTSELELESPENENNDTAGVENE